ncbi:hypothetical protein BG004_006411 [Podila humilis]|nr:hypothetical protein BG004_006411 [Podila humilis]
MSLSSSLCLQSPIRSIEGTIVASNDRYPTNDEDDNAIYNKVCAVLQSLIADAQKALQRTFCSVASPCHCTQCDESIRASPFLAPRPRHIASNDCVLQSAFFCTQVNQSSALLPSLDIRINDNYKHERYHKAFTRTNQQLEIHVLEVRVDKTGSECNSSFYGPVHLTSSPTPSISSSINPSQPSSPTTYRPGVLKSPLRSSIKGRLSSDSEASVEPCRKKNQVQFVESDEAPRSRSSRSPRRVQRRFKSQAVGSNSSSTGVIIQLYGLWKQTWLRARLMHVLTGSFEVMVVVVVLIRTVKASLMWVGLQTWADVDWISWLHGQREAGAGAKDLYEKIKRHGSQWRHIQIEPIKEPEESEATTSLLSPARVVYGPAKKALKDVATGAALAYVSDNVWRFIRKF